jgi:CheY-like chemotaxis protein
MPEKLRIVFIDDNPSMNRFSELIIEMDALPFEPAFFTRPEEAMLYLQQCHNGQNATPFPDVIMLDLNMPRMHGFEFVERYMAEFAKAHPRTLLYILSTTRRSEDEQKALLYEAVGGFYEKPFAVEMAAQILEDVQAFQGPGQAA